MFPAALVILLFVLLPIASIWFGVDSRRPRPAFPPVVAAVKRAARKRACAQAGPACAAPAPVVVAPPLATGRSGAAR